MVPILAKMSVDRKCEFEHVILLGNYELSYALGKLTAAFGLEKVNSFSSVIQLQKDVIDQIGTKTSEDVKIQRLLRVVKEMDDATDDYDDQMYELYCMGTEG